LKYLKLAFAGSLLFACAILMAGCGSGGSGSSTNGTLTLSSATATDQTGGTYRVDASATYVPPAGKVPNGAQIVFSWVATPAGSSTSSTGSKTTTLGSNGIGIMPYLTVPQTIVPIHITVIASIGDLTQSLPVTIPAAVPFSATQEVIAFASTDAYGASQTITLAGTFAPYYATTTSSDIKVSISGSTVTVAKISLTGTTRNSAHITLTDNNKATIDVLVYYY